MPSLAAWNSRAPEEARLFNPAFLSSLSTEFVKAYGSKRDGSAPLTLAAIALAISLHGGTRRRLPYSIVTSLYEWLQQNEDVLIGFPERTHGLMAYIREAIIFAVAQEVLAIREGHHLQLGSKKAPFSKGFIDETTAETRDIIDRTKFVGRWFAKSGSESSILAAWGVRP
ncbi:three component ABC system middle component [Pararhizobium sp. IMCC21322]|uniref:three component ABC system middle component n=1 Tax=Pararhizobium sp. IMCC21322 TaxID=3067903 RepID=UPI002741926D|nr:three component ABC system middle component [Pararhizobium sp. IMCC21322]